MIEEYKRAREEMAIQICDKYGSDNWTDLPKGERQDLYELATQILSLNGIEIRADDQSLPEIMCRNAQAELVIRGYDLAQQEMKEEGFIKVIPKGIK